MRLLSLKVLIFAVLLAACGTIGRELLARLELPWAVMICSYLGAFSIIALIALMVRAPNRPPGAGDLESKAMARRPRSAAPSNLLSKRR